MFPSKDQLPKLTRKGVNKCFGCGRENPIGLKLNFRHDGEKAQAEFLPGEFHQGWPGIIHGGIIYTLLDEAMGYAVYPLGVNCLTAKTEVVFKRPAPVGEPLILTGVLTRKTRKLIHTAATLTLKDGTLIAQSSGLMYVINHEEPHSSSHSSAHSGTELRAVIWDLDGVIIDTAPFHFQAWREVFQEEGVEFSETDFMHSFGLRNEDIIRRILGDRTSESKISAIATKKEERFRRKIEGKATPSPGALLLMRQLQERGFKQGIASSAPRENVRLLLKAVGAEEFIQDIVSEEDVHRGKPAPEVFLVAARKLGALPRSCVVIEDAVAGVRAAKAAGMKCLAITTTHPRESLAEADLVVDNLKEINISTIEKLLSH
jgi:beta-phosphoglucomutase family hydrolase